MRVRSGWTVAFTVDELVVTADDTAYALTRSNGTQTVLATGDESAESNREILLFQRSDSDGWKIGRYMFNKAEERAGRSRWLMR